MFLWFYLYTNVCIPLLCIFVPFAIRLEEKEQTGNKESNRKDMERVKHFLAIVMLRRVFHRTEHIEETNRLYSGKKLLCEIDGALQACRWHRTDPYSS